MCRADFIAFLTQQTFFETSAQKDFQHFLELLRIEEVFRQFSMNGQWELAAKNYSGSFKGLKTSSCILLLHVRAVNNGYKNGLLFPTLQYTASFAGTKETAFITAISSAAVAEAVIRACSMGIWSDCSCDTRSPPARSSGSDWKWSGCSDNVEYGLWFSRQFNDAPEEIKRKDARSVKDAMNLHNKAAGRAVSYIRRQKFGLRNLKA